MVCLRCGAANDDRQGVCSQCRGELSLPTAIGDHKVLPSGDFTQISPCNNFQENIIGGRFKIIGILGRGGMGEVFLAEEIGAQRKVAVKSISSRLIRDPDAQASFRSEARAASLLNHPNICPIYEIARENEREYIIMPFVDGVTLDQLAKIKLLSLAKIVDIAMQVAEGMIAAQAEDIVHRDLKPGNIMIDKTGRVVILDFGLAEVFPGKNTSRKNSRPEPAPGDPGVVLGTVAYMSPEQAEGRELDGRSDVFSFGVLLHELLAGENPFSDNDHIVTLYNIIHKEITPGPGIPPVLQKIVRKTLQKDRDRRYRDFKAVKKALVAARTSLAGMAD
jgi:eukaryotic-like serine/threonine-protein kinase